MSREEKEYLEKIREDGSNWWEIPERYRNNDNFIKDAICLNFRVFDMLSADKALDKDIQRIAMDSAMRYVESMNKIYDKYLTEEESKTQKEWLYLDCVDLLADKIEFASKRCSKNK